MTEKHSNWPPLPQLTSEEWEELLKKRRKETSLVGDEPWEMVFPDGSSTVGISISTARKSGIPEHWLKRCKFIEIPDLKP